MHARRKEADQGERPRLRQRVARPEPEPLAEVGQDGRVLGQRLAVVEAQHRHAPLRVELEIGVGSLLAVDEVDDLLLIFLAALLEHDMRGERARPGREIQRQHGEGP